LTLKTKIQNRSSTPILATLRLQPHLAGLPHNIALDLDKRFSWTGVLQRKLGLIPPGEAVESEIGVVALCSGIFEVGATVEEIELAKAKDDEKGARQRSDSLDMLQASILGEPALRTWNLKEPCAIIARRNGSV
jgi:trafficking protein particle complex subunit 9